MLKKILLAGAAATLLIGTAQAADIVEPTAYDWTGAYIGLQAGYAWGDGDVDLDISPLVGFQVEANDLDPDGFVGGLHAGYLLQSGGLVFGIEGDIEYADIHGSSEIEAPQIGAPAATVTNLDYDIDWLGSLRLRLGYAFDRVLLYATGGVAVGGVSYDSEVKAPFNIVFTDDSDDSTQWGWTLGGGLDYAIWDNVSLRLEYRYTDLGKSGADVAFIPPLNLNVFNTEVKNDFHTVRAGVSWRF